MSVPMSIDGIVSCVWSLSHRQNRMFSEDGKGNVYNFGDPYWMVQLEYAKKTDSQFRSVSALLQSLEGANNEIELYNVTRQTPVAFNGVNATVSALSVSSGVVDITTQGRLSLGDFISYDTANGRFVGEIIEIVSTPTATRTTFKTSPPALDRAGTHNGEVYRAHGLFKLEPDSLNIQESIGAGPGRIQASFRQVSP